MRFIFALLFFTVLILPAKSNAQNTESDKAQKSNIMVSVPVAVSDREGHYINGLKKGDFTLFEDGIEQKITLFATFDEPLNVALLLDTSISTKDTLDKIKDAAGDFIKLLKPNDKCLIATFDSRVNLLNSFTSNKDTLEYSLDNLKTANKEGTVVYNAVEQIIQNSFNKVFGRKAIVLLSDGKDLGSSVTKNKLLNLMEESEVLIYTVFYKTGVGNKLTIDADGKIKEIKSDKKPKKKKQPKKDNDYSVSIPSQVGLPTEKEIEFIEQNADIEAINSLKEMSDTTAGRFYFSDTPRLREIFKKVAAELKQQYRLGYRSRGAGSDVSVRSITVKVNRSDAVVRARGRFRAKQL